MIRMNYGNPIGLGDIPVLPPVEFRQRVVDETAGGARLVSMFGYSTGTAVRLVAILAFEATGRLAIASTDVEGSYDALTPDCQQAHLFEREILENTGLVPTGHPWLKPVRFSNRPIREDDFYRVAGDEVHEVAVGPVHAGIIEPGHFRFQCLGEEVLNLEIMHGYQHRGIEAQLRGGPDRRTVHCIETLAGDTSVGHALAYCQAVEALAGISIDPQADMLRGIALELERVANHAGDLGALANDVGFQPTAASCGRLRGAFLNITGTLCGSRFGRGLVRPGGTGCRVDSTLAANVKRQLNSALEDLDRAVAPLWETPSVLDRFEGTGRVTMEWCRQFGFVGPVARACGQDRDVRYHFPSGVYRLAHLPVSTGTTGDVLGRARVRWLEIQRSADFIRSQLEQIQAVELNAPAFPSLGPNLLVTTLVEGWRGEICHCAITDDHGRFAVYKVVDPSFHNWTALELAMRRQQISDFPLCNKSMNLSYCGFDQ